MPNSNIRIYGTKWCWDCHRALGLFDKYNIPYEWVNIDEDKSAEQYVLQANNGMRSVPTIVFSDGSILVEPSNSQLAEKLGLTNA